MNKEKLTQIIKDSIKDRVDLHTVDILAPIIADRLDASGVIVPPCKVGDVVFALWEVPTETKYVIYCAEVKEIRVCKKNNRLATIYGLEPVAYRGRMREYFDYDFGKLVFTNKEEAEKSLNGEGK